MLITQNEKEAQKIENQTQKVAKYIPRESPFFRLYTEHPTLDEILHIGNIQNTSPVDFSEALRAFRDMTGWTSSQISFHGKIANTTFVAHVINRGGHILPTGKQEYEDTRYAQTTPKTLIHIAKTLTDKEIENNKQFDSKGIDRGGRISLVFYDCETGNLLLKTSNTRSIADLEQRVVQAKLYLQEPFNYLTIGEKIKYLEGILLARFTVLKKSKINIVKDGSRSMNRMELYLRLRSKLKTSLSRAAYALGIIPVYLIFPPQPDEVKASDQKIREHLKKIKSHTQKRSLNIDQN